MSDTPETNAQDQRPIRVVIKRPDGATTHYIPADFARKLERERNQWKRMYEQAEWRTVEAEALEVEVQRIRAVVRALRRQIAALQKNLTTPAQ